MGNITTVSEQHAERLNILDRYAKKAEKDITDIHGSVEAVQKAFESTLEDNSRLMHAELDRVEAIATSSTGDIERAELRINARMDETVSSLSDLSTTLSAYTADSAKSQEPSAMEKAISELSVFIGPKKFLLEIIPEIKDDYSMEPEALMREEDPVLTILGFYLSIGEERTRRMEFPTVHRAVSFERAKDLLLQHCRDFCLPPPIVEDFVDTLQGKNFHMMTVSSEAVGRELAGGLGRTNVPGY